LRTHEGITYNSFLEVAKARGLLHDDTVWNDTLSEAITFGMPNALRQLFAFICVFGDPISPKDLWKKFLHSFVEDYAHKHPNDCNLCEDLALRDVAEILRLHVKNCSHFGLRSPPLDLPSNPQDVIDCAEELIQADKLIATLYPEQKIVFEEVMQAIYSPTENNNCFFY